MKIKPTNDLLFKKMMTTIGKEYILEDFIEAVTGMKLTNIRPTNPYQIETYQKTIENLNPVMYSTIVDVAATTEDGMEIMIEMQLYQHKDFFERIFNYMATTYTQNYKAETAKPIISIVVTNFTVFPEFQEERVEIGLTNFAYHREIRNKKQQPYWRIYLVNLTDKAILEEENTDFSEWRDFLKNGTINAKSSRGLKEAQKIVNFSNLAGEERRLAELMEKYEDVYYQVMKHQLEEGIEQGIEIGRQQGVELGEKRGMEKGVALGERKGQVTICFKMNLPMEEIQKYTGLSIEEIETFRKEME